MKLRFLGVGTAASGPEQYQSNMLITNRAGRHLLLDCGGDIRFSLAACGIAATDLAGVYISHLHGDHIGGLEWLALGSRFAPVPRRPPLYCEEAQLRRLWDHALRAGLECVDGAMLTLADYFDCRPLSVAEGFEWEGITAELIKMPHVLAGTGEHPSFGLLLHEAPGPRVFISTDTRFAPDLLAPIADRVDLIFHDCETSPVPSGVHTPYTDLLRLPDALRARIWLYHYQPAPHLDPLADGFRGFVTRGQVFDLDRLFPPAGLAA